MAFGITKSVGSEVQTCTKDLLRSFITTESIKSICKDIADEEAKLDSIPAEDEAEQKTIKDRISALKKKLPAITPMAIFRDGKRAVKNAIPSGLNMLDIDHIKASPQPSPTGEGEAGANASRAERLLRSVCDWDNVPQEIKDSILCIYMTPSTHGIRFIFVQPRGKNIEEGQRWMAEKLGINLYDGVTKDLARLSFLVPEEYFYKLDDALFEDWSMYAPASPKGAIFTSVGCQPYVSNGNKSKSAESAASYNRMSPLQGSEMGDGSKGSAHALPLGMSSLQDSQTDSGNQSSLPTGEMVGFSIGGSFPIGESGDRGWGEAVFHGIPYKAIIDRLLLAMGYDGDPSEGERNTALYALTRDMRYICDFNADKLFHVLPHWGLPDAECESTIKSALNTVRKTELPEALKRVITSLEFEYKQNETDSENLEDWQRLPQKLPRLLQLLVKGYPEEYRPAVVMSAIVTLGTILTRVRSEYIDGGIHSPSFLCCIVGHQASGKSFVRKIYEILTEPIKRSDENARRILKQYKKEKEAAKNSKKQPVEPEVMIRLLPATASGTTILKRADQANSKHIIMFTEELDQLTKGESANWSKKSDILRQAFDNSVWGQDYQSDQSYSAMVKLYYNLICCATPHAMNRFFKDVEDGLVSRFIFCKLPDTLGAKAPNFGRFSKKDLVEIRDIVNHLFEVNEAKTAVPVDATDEEKKSIIINGVGEKEFDEDKDAIWIESKRLTKAIENWLEGHRLEFLQNQENKALEIFRRRAAVIGYRAGLVAYMLCGGQMNATAIALALWVAEYTLQNQLAIFGEAMNRVMNEDEEDLMEVKAVRFSNNIKIFDMLPEMFCKDDVVKLRTQAGLGTNIRYIVYRWQKNGLIEKIDNNKWHKLAISVKM